jgi:hypothetical protein
MQITHQRTKVPVIQGSKKQLNKQSVNFKFSEPEHQTQSEVRQQEHQVLTGETRLSHGDQPNRKSNLEVLSLVGSDNNI